MKPVAHRAKIPRTPAVRGRPRACRRDRGFKALLGQLGWNTLLPRR